MCQFMNSVLKGQILHYTDWLPIDHERALIESREMGLKAELLDTFLAGNTWDLLKNSYDKN